MVQATIRGARLNLSKLLALVERGEEVEILRRRVPAARLVGVRAGQETRPFPDFFSTDAVMRRAGKELGIRLAAARETKPG